MWGDGRKIHFIDRDAPMGWRIKSQQQFSKGGLAGPIFSNQRNSFSRLNREIDIFEHRLMGTGIGKRNGFKSDRRDVVADI
jgi:hypothetical protein